MMNDQKISELTISQLKRLIRDTVQESVAEVIIEFSIAAELEEQLVKQADMTHLLQTTMHGESYLGYDHTSKVDD